MGEQVVYCVLHIHGWEMDVVTDMTDLDGMGELSSRSVGDHFRAGKVRPYVRWPYVVWKVAVKKSNRGR